MMYRTKDVNGSFVFFTTFIIANFSKKYKYLFRCLVFIFVVGIVLCPLHSTLRVGSSIYRDLMAAQKSKTITEQRITRWLRIARANKLHCIWISPLFHKNWRKINTKLLFTCLPLFDFCCCGLWFMWYFWNFLAHVSSIDTCFFFVRFYVLFFYLKIIIVINGDLNEFEKRSEDRLK